MIRRCPECYTDLSYEEAWHGQKHTCSTSVGSGYFEQKELLEQNMSNYLMNTQEAYALIAESAPMGKKYDNGKPKMHLLPPKALLEVARVLTFGADKYGEENWRDVADAQKRYASASLRHVFSHLDGEESDEETNYSHLAHAICCLMFKLELELESKSEEGKEKALRELIEGKHREGDSASKPEFFGKTYHKETGV